MFCPIRHEDAAQVVSGVTSPVTVQGIRWVLAAAGGRAGAEGRDSGGRLHARDTQ